MNIDFFSAKKRLATLWFTASGIIFVIMLLQTINGKFEDKSDEAWGWLFSNVIPVLSLMLSVFLLDISSAQKKAETVPRFFFQLVFFLSIAYHIAIFSVILLQPFSNNGIIQLMQESNIYIGPFQGLVTAAVGLFFFKKEYK